MEGSGSRVRLVGLEELDRTAWQRVRTHFRDPEIARLNGTPPSRMPLWLLRTVLRNDSRRSDRHTFGIIAHDREFIGLTELYDAGADSATLGIIIGERPYWGRGYGTETVGLLLDYAFGKLGLEKVVLNTYEDNLRAQASFLKAGFTEDDRLVRPGDRGRRSVIMSISRSRWQELRPQPCSAAK